MDQLKQRYDYNLNRIDRAFSFFNRSDVPAEDKEKQLKHFNQLLKEQNELMYKLNLKAGEVEVIEGFKRISA